MITVEEKYRGRSGDAFNREIVYVVIGTDGDAAMDEQAAIQAVIDETEEEYEGLFRANAIIREYITTPTRTIVIIAIQYGELDGGGGGVLGPEGEAVYEFAYQAPSEHIYFALATTSYGTTPPDIKNKVFVTADGEHLGLDLPAGNTTNVWRINTTASFVTSQYEALVESLIGSVNSADFKGRPAGSMRFVQCDSQVTSGNRLSLSWGFQYSANVTGLSFGSITGIDKPGHRVMWQLDERTPDNGKLVLVPRAVYVQQVFPEADLNQLGF